MPKNLDGDLETKFQFFHSSINSFENIRVQLGDLSFQFFHSSINSTGNARPWQSRPLFQFFHSSINSTKEGYKVALPGYISILP